MRFDWKAAASSPILGVWMVVFATLCLGFAPFVVLSLLTNSFWPHSSVDVPLTFVPSVLIGDSILLPTFNARTYLIFMRTRRQLPRVLKRRVLYATFSSLLVSAPLIVYEHLQWCTDQYTGFIDLQLGRLSAAGLWHTCFAILETTVAIFCLALILALTTCDLNVNLAAIPAALRAFVAYASLAIADFVIMHYRVVRASHRLLLSDFIAFAPLLISLLFLTAIRSRALTTFGRPAPLALKLLSSLKDT